jgi:hypothetical protein
MMNTSGVEPRCSSCVTFIIPPSSFRRAVMADLIYVALTVVFFLLALAYVRGCERLQ